MSESNSFRQPTLGPNWDLDLGEILFSRMPMGIAILDRKYNIIKYNPTWAEFSSRYAPKGSAPLAPGVNYFNHVAGSESIVIPLFERVLEGETITIDGMRLEAGGVTSYWDNVLSPLNDGEGIVGILSVSVDATGRMLVQQELEQRVEERTHDLDRRREIAESFRDIISMINANLPLDLFLEKGVELAVKRLEATASILHQFDLENEVIFVLNNYGMGDLVKNGSSIPFSELEARGGKSYLKATLEKKPTFINYPELPDGVEKIKNDATIPEHFKKNRIRLRQRFAGSFSVPLFVQNEVYGGMVFYYSEQQEFSEDQIELGLTFAEQVGLAIENAMLLDKVEEAAVIAERNRLARDLHDAVTQTLFSSSMIADVLPIIWEKDPEEGFRLLEDLRKLTRGALSEMRTLLVELRPTALAEINFEDLIQHQVNAFTARTGIAINFASNCPQDPRPDVKEMCYRITQEALNNIAKHANASAVEVDLRCQADSVSMRISDNGIGFDPIKDSSEGMGLDIMQERAESLGGSFQIHSQIGKGTTLEISLSGVNNEEKTDAN